MRKYGCKDVEFGWDEVLTTDWNDARRAFRDAGITPTLSYTGALQTNATGGTDQAWTGAGQLALSLDFNLQKSLKIPGLSVTVGASVGHGGNLSNTIRNTFAVNTLYAPSYYLGEMYVQESLLDGNLLLAAGRMASVEQFATMPVLSNFVNSGFNGNVGNIGVNDEAFIGPPPGVEWGAQVVYQVTTPLQISFGLYNNNYPAAEGADHGTYFRLQDHNKGSLFLGQVTYAPQQGPFDSGMPGEYTVGIFHDSNSFTTLAGSSTVNSISGFYALAQQQVWQPSRQKGSGVGLTLWGDVGYMGGEDRNTMPEFFGGGGSYQGLIPGRSQDSLNAGWIYGGFSKYLQGATAEKVLELNYQWNPKSWLNVVPDFQYVWRPSGMKLPNSAVFGVQVGVTF